jgi:hypothetical protein
MKFSLTYLLLLSLLACTRKAVLQETRWSGEGERPSLSTQGLIAVPEWRVAQEKLQMAQQTIEGFPIEDTFIKTITKDKGVVFQSSALLEKLAASDLNEAKDLDRDKAQIWEHFLKRNPEYLKWRLESAVIVKVLTTVKVKPVLSAELSALNGEIFEVQFNKTGELLKKIRLGSNFDRPEVVALAYPKGPKKSDLSQVMLQYLNRPEGLANRTIEVKTESPFKILPTQNLLLPPVDERFDQIQVYYFSSQLINWLEKKLFVQGPLKIALITNMGYPEKTNTAFYFRGQVRLGTGDDVTYRNIAWDPSIVMHEVSHALIDALSRLPFQGEGGSINEGFADTITTFYLESPYLGENSYKKADYKRSVEPILSLNDKNGGLYHDSAIVSSFFWELKNTIGSEKTLQLVVKILGRLGPNSNFKDYALVLKEQVSDLFKDEDLIKVNNIMIQRGL